MKRPKKTLILIASAALAFSMFSSTLMADTIKTSSDFKDLASVDTGLKAKIDSLLAKGVFEGVSGDSFGISQNMTRAQFAKVAALIFGLPVDASNQTSSFSDVRASDAANGWAIPYIEAARKAGLIDGITDTTFAPGDNVTIGQLDTVLVKGLGKSVQVNTLPWYANAVLQAQNLGIHPDGKSGDAAAARSDLVTGAYGAEQAYQSLKDQALVSLTTVQASDNQLVLVTLDKAVDTAKATLTLSKDGTVIPTTFTWNTDRKSASLTLSSDNKLSNGSYVVTLGGLVGTAIQTASGTFTFTTSSSTGGMDYTINGNYDLSNVLDSGLTALATGANGFATKTDAENPTTSKFAKEITIKATNSGQEVAVPGLIQSITSQNPTVVKTGISTDHKGYILGIKAGSSTINIIYSTISGETKQVSIPVTVKTENVAASLITAETSSFKATVSGSVYGGSGQFNAFDAMDLTVTDNYGIKYEDEEVAQYNFALGVVFFAGDIAADPAGGAVGTVSLDLDGTVHINGNVSSFTLTALLMNGTRAYTAIEVVKN
ncbi:S-layer homology domain-containing protein [Paenibacillus agricola]|uniref:S-layer homology domain-containing protein n=1 Tax=Paenibacillus agricola TaxID=2716264 RepID=A0ABX0JD74_9BACL|nr:S-layer homology domain-containing protein [Paenibacillus agricola]NHN34430.1 S-layer homology domain-containing protein [Paenibacillus agricola]